MLRFSKCVVIVQLRKPVNELRGEDACDNREKAMAALLLK
jgi:hypothetical protein